MGKRKNKRPVKRKKMIDVLFPKKPAAKSKLTLGWPWRNS